MVARDGIEPPTPAFSGPRSTTELSGLGITLVVGDRQEPPARYHLHLSPRPLQGSLSPAGIQQRKRILSIAIPRHTANLLLSRYPVSSLAPQGRSMLSRIELSTLHRSLSLSSSRLCADSKPTLRRRPPRLPPLRVSSAPSVPSTRRSRVRSNSRPSSLVCQRAEIFTCISLEPSTPRPSSRTAPLIFSALIPKP